ncbi:sugar phosphate isomerase/epimerase family protein [Botrimarina hoheduenensis]|uniref:L-ribulose-5-phosphate 3-epimerase UlaE n=1 Tax=Botrimarina hoheduenensis TaxID=2528000 RepID=A0A5C5VY32_9BACT|nr:sugar phosphate isomerase/epimerase family protein [Botrimarina hoheduenensis]TWT42843.1 L-ribulose-5-phosphate 3-epimerase UlaE [Botrimarina hoheduenensis]
MLLGYNTNGFAHHRVEDAIELLASLRYRAVGLTIDHGCLAPNMSGLAAQVEHISELRVRHDLALVVETGARFLLDPRAKHEPTLVTADPAQRRRRTAFYHHAIKMASLIGARVVSIWSGVLHDDASREEAFERIVQTLPATLAAAADAGVRVGFEPEPGMVIATIADYEQLFERLQAAGAPIEAFGLTLDVGHLHCNGELPLADRILEVSDQLVNVHIEDMCSAAHEHLMFGRGEIDFLPVIGALNQGGYRGPLLVELSRDSHRAPEAAKASIDFLLPLVSSPESLSR